MISESCYWKMPLLETAERLRSLKAVRGLNEEQLTTVERDIFVGFYSVRKLFETITKVTDSMKCLRVQVSWYPNRKHVNWKNNHRIHELYDLAKESNEHRDIWFVSSRIIHSFIFTPYVEEQGGLAGIMFTSDRDQDIKLYSMDIDGVIAIFERVGNDDPTTIKWSKNVDTGEETTLACFMHERCRDGLLGTTFRRWC